MFVGVDAHIDPANKTDFTQLQCEFDGAQWGDVGIAPYAKTEKFQKSRKGVPWGHIKSSKICKNSLPGLAGQGFLFSEDLREEVPESLAFGVCENFVGRALFEKLSVCHEEHAVGNLAGKAHLMRHDDHRHTGLRKLLHNL